MPVTLENLVGVAEPAPAQILLGCLQCGADFLGVACLVKGHREHRTGLGTAGRRTTRVCETLRGNLDGVFPRQYRALIGSLNHGSKPNQAARERGEDFIRLFPQ